MKIKVFTIRLNKENFVTDQNLINAFLDTVVVKETASELISGAINFWSIVIFYEEQKASITSEKIDVSDENDLSQDEKRVYQALKRWRMETAATLGQPPFLICHNNELLTVAKNNPKSFEDLAKIKGFGPQKISKFGDDILEVLNSI